MEQLLSYDADMVATNEEGQTPADVAKAKQHGDIATSLEAKMVFSVRVPDQLIVSLEFVLCLWLGLG